MNMVSEEVGRVLGSQIFIYNSPAEIPDDPPKDKNDVFIDINLGKLYQWDGTEWKFKFDVPNDSRIADIVEELTALGASLRDAESQRVLAEQGRVTAEEARQLAESQRASAEAARQSAEGSRQTAESGRETAEGNRSLSEQSRETAEGQRAVAEGQRATAEEGRASAESARASAESARASAESSRETAEQARASAESARAGAESSRATAEGQRATAETARASAESGRVTAEQGRASAETTRGSNETTRQGNESTRQSNESTRQGNETSRGNAEASRVAAENARVLAEQSRAAAESARVLAEQARVEAENARVLAEQGRAAEFAGFEGEIESKITRGAGERDGTLKAGHADSAKSLDTELGNTDETPFSSTTVGINSDVETGQQVLKKLVGVDLVKNQLVKNGTFSSYSYWSASNASLSISDNVATVAYSSTSGRLAQSLKTIQGHKYLCGITVTSDTDCSVVMEFSRGWEGPTFSVTAGTKKTVYAFITLNSASDGSNLLQIYPTVACTLQLENIFVIGLTQRYGNNDVVNAIIGSTAADYVKNLLAFDPSILKDLSYDAGSFPTIKAKYLETVDYNQWDEQVELGKINYTNGQEESDNSRIRAKNIIRVMPNTAYYCKSPDSSVLLYAFDENDNYIGAWTPDGWVKNGIFNVSNKQFITPSNCSYLKLAGTQSYGATYNHDICIFLYWDGSRIGYEEYQRHLIELPNEQLHGILKVVNGKVVADGDERYPNRTGKTRYKAYTFTGSEAWESAVSDGVTYYQISLSNVKANDSNYVVFANCITNMNATNAVRSSLWYYPTSRYFAIAYGKLGITSALYNDRASLVGKTLIYQVNNETDVESTAFPESFYGDDFGVMRFLDEDGNEIVGLLGAEILYKANVAGFAESLYSKANGDPDAMALNTDVASAVNGLKSGLEGGEVIPLKSILADNFDSKLTIPDVTAYNFRTTAGGEEVANQIRTKAIVGGSLGWNQLIQNGNFADSAGWNVNSNASMSVSNNKCTVTAISNGNIYAYRVLSLKNYHVYLTRCFVKASVSKNFRITWEGYTGPAKVLTANERTEFATIGTVTNADGQGHQFRLTLVDVAAEDSIELEFVNAFDLTAAFGATIANYIASLESANAGAGVAWFKRYFPKAYYAYKAIGGFTHVQTKGKKYVRFNQFNKVTATLEKRVDNTGSLVSASDYACSDYIDVFGGYAYYFKDIVGNSVYYSIIEFDASKNVIGDKAIVSSSPKASGAVTLSSNAAYIRINMYKAFIDTVNVSIHWDGERDGEFEEYKSNVYDTDPIELIGIPKIDAEGNLYYEGNRYNSDGSVENPFILYTFTGNESFAVYGTGRDGNKRVNVDIPNMAQLTLSANKLGFSPAVRFLSVDDGWASSGGVISRNDYRNGIFYYSTTTDSTAAIAEAKSLLVGTSIILPLTTATQSSATPFTELQIGDNWGTEQWLAPDDDTRSVEVPVGSDTDYLPDLKAKTESAPSNPDTDGDYVMHRENGENSYTPLATYLSENWFKDLSSGITDKAGLTYELKKAYRSGNSVTLSIQAQNLTGSTIAAGTALFRLPSGAYNASVYLRLIGRSGVSGSLSVVGVTVTNDTGDASITADILNDGYLWINASFVVA